MNRTFKLLSGTLLCMAALSACKDSEDSAIPDKACLQPEISVQQQVSTRKTETYFNEGEEVGILLLTPAGNLYNTSVGFEKYTYLNRRWDCINPTILENNEVRVFAFYPWSTSLSYANHGSSPFIETATQTDYLIGKQVDGSFINAQYPTTRIDMKHALTQVRFSIAKGSYTGTGKLTSAEFICTEGNLLGTNYQVDVTTGNISATAANVDRSRHNIGTWGRDGITLTDTPHGPSSTEFMFIPGNGKIKINLTIDNIAYSVTCNLDGSQSSNGIPRTLTSGSVYTIHLRMSGAALEITSDNVELHNWYNAGALNAH